MFDLINRLTKISPRFGHDEAKAAEVITDTLKALKIPYKEEPFDSSGPRMVKAELFADDMPVPCIGSSMASGEIKDGKYLISAFGYAGEKRPYNICYSPITDEISVVDFFNEPSVTISRKSVVTLVMADKVRGRVEVEEEKFKAENILVGNGDNPETIVIAHYDSIVGDGAVDNAGAVATVMEAIKLRPEILHNNLVVFAGNEEISYDNYKTRSGYGFRAFESEHGEQLKAARQIIVIDGIGVGHPAFVQTGLNWVLQVKMLDEIRGRVFWLQNDQSEVLKYFHTKADVVDNLQEEYLKEATTALVKRLG
jgi:hypothetical protein